MRMPWLNRFILTTCLAVSGCQSAHTAEVCENFPVILESFDSPESPNVLALTQDPNYALGDDTDNNYLVATFVGNHVGSERNTRHLDLPPLDSATLSFDIWFEPDFDFVLGGKLPGFAPVTPAWGGETVEPAEWSNRIMWREGGKLVTYSYHQNLPHKWGEDSQAVSDRSLPVGSWVSLSLYTDLIFGKSEVWMDGEKIGELGALDFYAPGENSPITTLAFHSFFGGNTPEWAPKDKEGQYRNLTARFDNVGVYRGHCIRKRPHRDLGY